MHPPLLNLIFPLNGNAPNIHLKGRCATLLYEKIEVKDSLSMQCAVTFANQDELVTFITPKPFDKLPIAVHGMPIVTSSAMKNINFRYFTHIEDIRTFFSNISEPFPSLIILDQLDYFLQQLDDEDKDCSIAKFLGLLIDSLHYISERRNETSPVIATYCNMDYLSNMNIWKLFFTHVWAIDFHKEEKKCDLIITQLQNLEFDYKLTFYIKEKEIYLDKLFQINK